MLTISIVLKVLLIATICNSINAKYASIPGVNKSAIIVNLFEWTFNDIATECESFLAPYNYSAVLVSPVFEHAIIKNPDWDERADRPWYERYQPVSFKIDSRSGDKKDFKQMVRRCNDVGVRVIVDVVINHMTSSISGRGSAGSRFDGATFTYPDVGFDQSSFHDKIACPTKNLQIEDVNDLVQIKNCEILGKHDLDHSNPTVFAQIVKALQKLLDWGVAGFKIDSAKYIWPNHLDKIFNQLLLNSDIFKLNESLFVINDVQTCCNCGDNLVVSPNDYKNLGRTTEYSFLNILSNSFLPQSKNRLREINHLLQSSQLLQSNKALVFTDSPELQRRSTFGLNFRQSKQLKLANAFMLAWPYGNTISTIKLITIIYHTISS